MYKQPKEHFKFYDVFLIIRSPTCFSQ